MTSSPTDCDYSFLRAPFQRFSSLFKTNKRALEKELSFFASHLKTMSHNRGNLDRKQTLATIEALRNRLKANIESIEAEYAKEDEALEVCETRYTHMEDLVEYQKARIKRMMVDYLAREGMVQLAEKVAKQISVEKLTDAAIFCEMQQIKHCIMQRNLDSALKWCDLHKSRLKRLDSRLEFELKLQRYLELLKEQNNMGAIRYARVHFPHYPQYLEDVQRAMVLLAVITQPAVVERYDSLLSESRWEYLARLLQAETLRVYSLPTDSTLSIYLHAGLAALKTPLCKEGASNRCPACSEAFAQLAEMIPLTSHTNSQLMCRILDKPMDEHNPPMALPNGQTYSLQGLEQIAVDRKVIDPATGEKFSLKDLKKVFTL